MTLMVSFHASHYRDFKHYCTEYVANHLRPYFPDLVSYNRPIQGGPSRFYATKGRLPQEKVYVDMAEKYV